MLRLAIDRGVNYVDTAYAYHSSGRGNNGESEPFLSHALKDGYREKVKLATKLPTWLVENHLDMHKYLDQQLKFLGVDKIDFYLAHNLNMSCWDNLLKNRMLQFFDEAQKDGRIGFPSFSFHDEYKLFEIIVNSYDWAMAQIQYNYLDVDFQAGRAGLKLAHSRGMAVVIMEPLRGGFLVKYMPSEPKAWLKEAHPEWSLAAWALNWLWNQPEVSVVLSGMSDMEQLEDNLASFEAYQPGIFTAADETLLQKVVEFFQKRIQVSCTGCGYCLPCQKGVDIPKNLGFLNQFYLFDAEEAQERCRLFYGLLTPPQDRAENCVACGECEPKCPQGLEIPKFLNKAVDVFKSL
jgi:predicted aldo/keto reductase-like oxidoreductase